MVQSRRSNENELYFKCLARNSTAEFRYFLCKDLMTVRIAKRKYDWLNEEEGDSSSWIWLKYRLVFTSIHNLEIVNHYYIVYLILQIIREKGWRMY
jgi:hypothetical protein